MEKIKLQEKESFSQKFKAIKAWQKSPLNQLYLEIGHQCLETEGSDLDEIIRNRQVKEKQNLNNEEFKAIMDLNRKLRQYK